MFVRTLLRLLAQLLDQLAQFADVLLHVALLAPELLFARLLCALRRAPLLAQTSLALQSLLLQRAFRFL